MENHLQLDEIMQAMTAGELDLASEKLHAALDGDSGNASYHFLLAAVCAQQGNVEGALNAYDASLRLAPEQVICRFQMGLLQATLEQYAPARRTLAPLKDLPSYIGHFTRAIYAIVDGDLDAAISLIDNGLALNDENPALNHDMNGLKARIFAQRVASTDEQTSDNNVQTDDKSHLLDIYQTRG